MDACEVRADVNAVVVADQLIALTSYAALLGQPLTEVRIDETVRMVKRGIAAH
ncbi:hypothetical protein PTQ19_00710 [Microbacterium esteraromaticum]|uniref:hypothetical protein n=1 Tax=Microbacterium esteraromaticum TaxID=57043 RepID=UPI00236833F1|nr:hypothetical protein [Microbacterium esteraromaticum]WDH78998.1 hypothetical protein PTQ19_00710 [Microbacterium esteraromaticum]